MKQKKRKGIYFIDFCFFVRSILMRFFLMFNFAYLKKKKIKINTPNYLISISKGLFIILNNFL